MPWIKIVDGDLTTLPELRKQVLVYQDHTTDHPHNVAWREFLGKPSPMMEEVKAAVLYAIDEQDGYPYFKTSFTSWALDNVTHWMPLPEGPQKKNPSES